MESGKYRNQTLSEFLAGPGKRHYRDLVQDQMRAHPEEWLMEAIAAFSNRLPESAQDHVPEFLDAVIAHFAHRVIWDRYTGLSAVVEINRQALKTMNFGEGIREEDDLYSDENEEIAYDLFMLATLNFAWSSRRSKNIRRAMGIRMGFFR